MSGDENFANSLLVQSRLKLSQMDFHAKDDIQKFQDKLLKVDKQLDKILKEKQLKCKEYRQVKEDYVQVISKKKALQSTFMHIMDQYDISLKKMERYQNLLEKESQKAAMLESTLSKKQKNY